MPKLWDPYDSAKRVIALSPQELRQHAERLYRQAGLVSALQANAPAASTHESASQAAPPQAEEQPNNGANSEFINERQLVWVKQQLQHDNQRIRNVCTHYRVEQLEKLTQPQTRNLINRLLAQATPSKNGTRSAQKAQK